MIGRTNSKCAGSGSGGGNFLYSKLLTETCVWTVPATGIYEIHIVGNGGNGGKGGKGNKTGSSTSPDGWSYRFGAGGGGGGSGSYTSGQYLLEEGVDIPVTIGGNIGTVFGTSGNEYYMVAGNGSVGQNGGDFRSHVGGSGGAGGTVTVAGNLQSLPGNAGSVGQASAVSDWDSYYPDGGDGGDPVYKGWGRGGQGGSGCVNEEDSSRRGRLGKNGGAYIHLIKTVNDLLG